MGTNNNGACDKYIKVCAILAFYLYIFGNKSQQTETVVNVANLEIKKMLSDKLRKAVKILHRKNTTVIEIINTSIRTKPIQPDTFSKCLNRHNHDERIPHPETFKIIFDILDPFIEQTYRKAWHEGFKEYLAEGEIPTPASNIINNERLLALMGVWEGYAWHKKKSDALKEGYFTKFKLHIEGLKQIKCHTQKSKFIDGEMELVRGDCFQIRLKNDHIRVEMMGITGYADTEVLSGLKTIKLGYINSGDSDIKIGLAVIKRVASDFDSIKIESIKSQLLQIEHGSSLSEYLENTQIVMDYNLYL